MADGVAEIASVFAPAAREGEVRAKLFTHGGSQAVRLPKAFRFEGVEVTVRRDGAAVILEPVNDKRPPTREEMEALWREIDQLRGDAVIEDPPRDRSPWRDPPTW